jgi:hypothetical protein
MKDESLTALINCDPDEISNMAAKVERSLNIRYPYGELQQVTTGEDFVQLTIKLLGDRMDDACTTQQAFYFLRRKLAEVLDIEARSIRPDTPLQTLLPVSIRHKMAGRFRAATGVKLLTPKIWFTLLYIPLFVANYLVNQPPEYQIPAFFILLFLITWLGQLTAVKLRFNTLADVTTWYKTNRYADVIRQRGCFNKREIEPLLKDICMDTIAADREALKPDAPF